jgi:ribosomal protein S18 acetylase RimI-like enzyme
VAPQIVDLRQLEARQFTPLLEAESEAWGEHLRWDFAASLRVISSCLQENRLSGSALLGDQGVEGYCFFFLDGEKGLIGDLFVLSGPAALDRAQQLLGQTLRGMMASSRLRRVEAQLPHFTLEQLDPSFRAHCFTGYRRRFMAVSLLNRPRPAQPSAANPFRPGSSSPHADFVIRPWERLYDQDAAQLLYSAYRNHVDAIINDQYASLAGATRLIENIVQQQGCGAYLPYASRVAIHQSTQRLAGILALTAVQGQTAHIPQVAVANQFQGTGVGTVLLESAFEELIKRDFREVSLTVTDLNAGAVRLYERLGFETFRTFGAFVWTRP